MIRLTDTEVKTLNELALDLYDQQQERLNTLLNDSKKDIKELAKQFYKEDLANSDLLWEAIGYDGFSRGYTVYEALSGKEQALADAIMAEDHQTVGRIITEQVKAYLLDDAEEKAREFFIDSLEGEY